MQRSGGRFSPIFLNPASTIYGPSCKSMREMQHLAKLYLGGLGE
jgi:hypothetical protein